TSVDWEYADNSLVMQDTTVWVKDFAKNPDEYVNQSTGEKVVVKGGSWKDVEDYLKPKSENSLGKNPLIIINGKEISKEEFKKLNIEYLEFDGGITATTYTKQEAIEKFGEKGKDGAIVIKGELTNFNLKASTESSDEKDLLSFLKSAKDYSE